MSDHLRQQCHTIIPGHRLLSAAEEFAAMATWCSKHEVYHDTYGKGDLIERFECELSSLLGQESALFVMTGTLAQSIALRLACEGTAPPIVGMHPTCHILKHEEQNYQFNRWFIAQPLGNAYHPWLLNDLVASSGPLCAVLYELPMREIGGQLPDWEELQAISCWCREQGIHFHMDGARLWEAAAGYGKPIADIAALFDTIYISFYKGIGALGGAMLLGSKAFIERARLQVKREGGNVYHRSPFVVSAAMQLAQRLAMMPALLERTRKIYQLLKPLFPQLVFNPSEPQVNLFHLHLPVTANQANLIRDELAREYGVWFCGGFNPSMLPNHSYCEIYVGDNLLKMDDAQVVTIFNMLVECLPT
ncbi:threonine aldolase family protein [Aeromonas aquatilis]